MVLLPPGIEVLAARRSLSTFNFDINGQTYTNAAYIQVQGQLTATAYAVNNDQFSYGVPFLLNTRSSDPVSVRNDQESEPEIDGNICILPDYDFEIERSPQ